MANLNDSHIAEIVAANLGCSPEHRTEALEMALEMALEIQQHRARIAAHATAHPERLSDGEINKIVAAYEDEPAALEDALDADTIAQLAMEILQRRAADLTFSPDAVDSLLGMRDFVQEQADYWRGKERGDSINEALEAYDRLLRSRGIEPKRGA